MCAQADWLTESNKLRLKYVLKSERLRTFDKWPFSDESNCSAEKMADAGFYVPNTKQKDLVTCFLCNKELDGWEETDDPWEEHNNHSNKCLLAQSRRPFQDLKESDVPIMYETLFQEFLQEYQNAKHDKRKKDAEQKFDKFKKPSRRNK